MKSLFAAEDRRDILRRLELLGPGAARQWGKMDPAQALAHCTVAVSTAVADVPRRQSLLGKIVTPFIRSHILGPAPFSRNSPTDPNYVVSDSRDFARERERLVEAVDRFCARGAAGVDGAVHPFFGRLSGDDWGVLVYKHLDHHLRQFGQ